MSNKYKVAVLGAGSWGTTLAHHLTLAGHSVVLWGRDESVLKDINDNKHNSRYLDGEKLAAALRTNVDIVAATKGVEVLVVAVPSSAVRSVVSSVKSHIANDALVVSTTKGLEEKTLKSMSSVIEQEVGVDRGVAVLSGPSFALEVLRGRPTAVTVAARSGDIADKAAEIFHFDNFRVYTSTDIIGVEYAGALKNVMAIAAGVVDGVGMGANARAALITRGLSEMQGLVVALGGKALTVGGLSGLGDLLLTATGDLSRNRQVGFRLGKGENLEDILKSLGQVAEGVKTSAKVLELARRHNVLVPITEQVDRLLSRKCSAVDSVNALLSRSRAQEIKF